MKIIRQKLFQSRANDEIAREALLIEKEGNGTENDKELREIYVDKNIKTLDKRHKKELKRLGRNASLAALGTTALATGIRKIGNKEKLGDAIKGGAKASAMVTLPVAATVGVVKQIQKNKLKKKLEKAIQNPKGKEAKEIERLGDNYKVVSGEMSSKDFNNKYKRKGKDDSSKKK